MPAIASAAGVSVPTVYKAFGNKARLAKAVFDVAMAGDDEPLPMLQRAALGRVRAEHDPRKRFRLYGEFLAEVAPRHVPVQLVIREAANSDPEAQSGVGGTPRGTTQRNDTVRRSPARRAQPRSGVTASEARDVLWTYNSAELFQLLVLERGWSPQRYGRWIADALIAALVT